MSQENSSQESSSNKVVKGKVVAEEQLEKTVKVSTGKEHQIEVSSDPFFFSF